MTPPAHLEPLAMSIALEAGALAQRLRGDGVQIADTKSTVADIVTVADREVERLIRDRLRDERPDDGFFGEESGAEPGTSGITWVVDPIDGTVNYAMGIPIYAVSIAAVEGEPTPGTWSVLAGAVCHPSARELFHASRGGGAWLGEDRLTVNAERPTAGALLATGFGYDPAHHAGDLARVQRVMPLARDLRRMGSAAIDLCYVAAGRLDGYFERGIHPWDHAAGELIVTEAGGLVGGDPHGVAGNELAVAAGPGLFAELLALARG